MIMVWAHMMWEKLIKIDNLLEIELPILFMFL